MTTVRWVVARLARDLGVTPRQLVVTGIQAVLLAPFVYIGFIALLTAVAVIQVAITGIPS